MHVFHIGINAQDETQALEWSQEFLKFFGIPVGKNGPKSVFAGDLVEIMKGNGRGTVGHIAIGVNNCEKAIEYFASLGTHVVSGSEKIEDGVIQFAYLDKEIAGFAVHISLVK